MSAISSSSASSSSTSGVGSSQSISLQKALTLVKQYNGELASATAERARLEADLNRAKDANRAAQVEADRALDALVTAATAELGERGGTEARRAWTTARNVLDLTCIDTLQRVSRITQEEWRMAWQKKEESRDAQVQTGSRVWKATEQEHRILDLLRKTLATVADLQRGDEEGKSIRPSSSSPVYASSSSSSAADKRSVPRTLSLTPIEREALAGLLTRVELIDLAGSTKERNIAVHKALSGAPSSLKKKIQDEIAPLHGIEKRTALSWCALHLGDQGVLETLIKVLRLSMQ
jgi:hypothetical protein